MRQNQNNADSYFCITLSPTQEELKRNYSQYLKIKSLYAVGWKLSADGALELTSPEKVTTLQNVFIIRKIKPQQAGVCTVTLHDSTKTKDLSGSSSTFDGEVCGLKLHVFTKKVVDLKGRSLEAALRHRAE